MLAKFVTSGKCRGGDEKSGGQGEVKGCKQVMRHGKSHRERDKLYIRRERRTFTQLEGQRERRESQKVVDGPKSRAKDHSHKAKSKFLTPGKRGKPLPLAPHAQTRKVHIRGSADGPTQDRLFSSSLLLLPQPHTLTHNNFLLLHSSLFHLSLFHTAIQDLM